MRVLFLTALGAMALAPTPQPAGLLAEEPTFAGVRVLYGPGEDFGSVDARLIGEARHSIDMAAYVLTDRSLMSALGRAAMRGVKVRIYLDGEDRGRGASAIEEIADAPNVEVRRKGRSRDLMHLKSYQVDGRVLRSGSANFSISGEVYQDNDLIVIESPHAAARFRDAFERLWSRPDNQPVGLR
ncbi:phospholipase D-like domain-containing protein [Methylocystis sp. B8]|uniref:phospholipase D-like domain-containing protein n=1 Tax=Methylocystis sp. B8 TaxID=544938 RepID=UPI0010FE261F|nr:phospholipase D-like domain-containing protein [Methylocystis sp. B8]TLG71598.1 phosphatidylserine synthase [Methylocystis sp. B8]